ncbi:MAG TPA: sugar phosphate isomerase/epimerase [Streptosporangiaceae bacterium]
MAQLGVLTSEFERPSLEETVAAIAGHGIGAVQFQLGSAVPSIPLSASLQRGLDVLGPHLSPGLCDQIREQLAASGIAMAAVDGTFNMVHPDQERRWANLDHLRRLIDYCPALGTSVVTLCTGSREDIMWRRHPDNDTPEAMADLAAVMKAAAQTAEEHGVTLAFEPEVNNVVNTSAKARQLIDEVGSPAVKVVMDPANIFKAGELPQMREKLHEAFRLLGDDIALAHAKDLDHDGEAGHLGAGEGLLDYPLYLSLLQGSGFGGTIVLHQMHHLSEAGIDERFAFVRREAPAGFLA